MRGEEQSAHIQSQHGELVAESVISAHPTPRTHVGALCASCLRPPGPPRAPSSPAVSAQRCLLGFAAATEKLGGEKGRGASAVRNAQE
jgi:hypothetical protein